MESDPGRRTPLPEPRSGPPIPQERATGGPPGGSSDGDLDRLLEEYLGRLRRGDLPTIEEYAAAHPDLAEDIRDLFPAMEAMEKVKDPFGDEAAAPERIGDFRIVREAGRGGMGVVYEAIQESLGRRVALKVLPHDCVRDERSLERFKREARAAARLHHTNIVPVFGVGDEGGVHYYAMQFIEGRSLDAILDEARRARGQGPAVFPDLTGSSKEIPAPGREGSRPHQEGHEAARSSSGTNSPERRHRRHHRAAARVALQVAEGLTYANAQGILHRDIKPSNLILDAGGTVWITDFGLAKSDDADSLMQAGRLTHAGDIVGTIAYLAPERFEGKSDARSDVYALGLTLYEILTLRPAFADENRRRLLKRVAEETPPTPRALDRSIPRDLETIVLTAIAKDPARRYPSAVRLADDLRSFLAGRPIEARRASAVERLGRWCRREPTLAALAGLVAVLLIATAALSFFGYLKLRELLGVATVNLDRAQSAEGQVRVELRRAYLAQARASRVGGQPGRRFDSLDAVRRAVALGPSEEERRALRDEAIAALSLSDLRVTRRWRKDPRLPFAFAPDLESFAVAAPDGKKIVLRRVADQTEIAQLPGWGARLGTLHYSDDGQFLAARLEEGRDRLAVVDLTSGEKIYTSTDPIFGVGVHFHPPSKLLAVASLKHFAHIIDLAERREVARHPIRPGTETVLFHPSGERLALASPGHGQIRIVEPRSGHELVSVEDGAGHTCLSWSTDGSLLAAGGIDGSVTVRELAGETLRPRWTARRMTDRVQSIHFNHGGSLLATHTWVSMLRLWDTANGEMLLAADWVPCGFSPDDRKLALALGNYEAAVAEVAESAICRTIDLPVGEQASVVRMHVSPDGRLLACGRHGGRFGFWLYDLKARRYLLPLPVPGGDSALFSADGQWFFTGGRSGLQRWPIERDLVEREGDRAAEVDGGGGGEKVPIRFGLPETLEVVKGYPARWVAQSADGKTLAIIGRREPAEVIVLALDGEARRKVVLSPHYNVDRISLRPDGNRLASSTWLGWDVKVWDTQSGRLELTIPLRDNAFVEFSPDGRWLAVLTPEACILHDAVTLERVWRVEKPAKGGFPGHAAFRGDGKLLAISYGRRAVRLIDPTSGLDLATIEAPASLAGGIAFHPDGSRLYAAAEDGRIYDWDLALLHRELAELSLDWAEPAR